VSRKTLLRMCSLFLPLLAFFCDCSWANPLSLEEYRSYIQDAISRVEAEKGPLNSEVGAFLDGQFPPHFDVNTKSGEPVPVDNGALLSLVKQAQETDQGREALLAHLKALRNQISFVDKPIPLSEDHWGESRALLQKVFSAREFQDLEEVKDPAWLAFVKELLRKVMDWLGRHRGPIAASGDWLEYIFYGVILSGLLLLVVWILRSIGPVGWRFGDLKVKSGQEKETSRIDWRALREESHHKGEGGAYREAIRLFFISVLMEGHERGWWVYRREATNREHLSGIEGSTDRREALERMIQVYENAWYGHESPGKESFLQCAEWLRLMEAG
jgi:hypothetical protein